MDIVVKFFYKLQVILYKVNELKIRKATMRKKCPGTFYHNNETNIKHHNENIVVLASDKKIANRKVQKHSQNQCASGNKCLFLLIINV